MVLVVMMVLDPWIKPSLLLVVVAVVWVLAWKFLAPQLVAVLSLTSCPQFLVSPLPALP